MLQCLNLLTQYPRKQHTMNCADWKTGKYFNLKGYCVIRHINSFCPKNISNVKNIPPGSSIHSNLYQHQFSLCKWKVSDIPNLKNNTMYNQPFRLRLQVYVESQLIMRKYVFASIWINGQQSLICSSSQKYEQRHNEIHHYSMCLLSLIHNTSPDLEETIIPLELMSNHLSREFSKKKKNKREKKNHLITEV